MVGGGWAWNHFGGGAVTFGVFGSVPVRVSTSRGAAGSGGVRCCCDYWVWGVEEGMRGELERAVPVAVGFSAVDVSWVVRPAVRVCC